MKVVPITLLQKFPRVALAAALLLLQSCSLKARNDHGCFVQLPSSRVTVESSGTIVLDGQRTGIADHVIRKQVVQSVLAAGICPQLTHTSKDSPNAKPRKSFSGTVVKMPDGRLFITGGMKPDSKISERVSETWWYDEHTDTVTAGPRLLQPRSQHEATLLQNGRVLITGGLTTPNQRDRNQSSSLFECEMYDPAMNVFVPAGRLHVTRTEHTATLLSDGRVLVAGGMGGTIQHPQSCMPTAAAEVFDPSNRSVIEVGDMTSERTGHSCLQLAGGRALIVGGAKYIDDMSSDMIEVSIPETFEPNRCRDR